MPKLELRSKGAAPPNGGLRKITISFNVSAEDYTALTTGEIAVHVNFADQSVNTVRLPWECPHCNTVNQPSSLHCNDCSLFIEMGERL